MARPQETHREPGEPVRAFFALELDAATRASSTAFVESLRDAPGGSDVRWVRPEDLHLTLRFLGEVAAERIDGLVASVAERITSIRPFTLELGAVAAFPSGRRPRIVIREVAASEPLHRLAAAVERGCQAAGLEGESRRFRPHLTLGRVRRQGAFPDVTAADTPTSDALDVTRIVLFRSELNPTGPRSPRSASSPNSPNSSNSPNAARYAALARLPLAPTDPARPRSPH